MLSSTINALKRFYPIVLLIGLMMTQSCSQKADVLGHFDKKMVKGKCVQQQIITLSEPGFLTNIFLYDQYIIAQNRTSRSIVSYSMEGDVVSEYHKPGTGPGEMSEYSNLWVVKQGKAYITDSRSNKVILLTIDPQKGELVFEDEFYIDSGQIVSLDVCAPDRLFVTSAMSDYKISEYDQKGKFVIGYEKVKKTKMTPAKVMESAYRVTISPKGALNSGIFNGELEFYTFENNIPELISTKRAAYYVKKGGMPPRPSVLMTTSYNEGYLISNSLPDEENASLLEAYTQHGEFEGFVVVEDQKDVDVVLVYPFGNDGLIAYQQYIWDEKQEKFNLINNELVISEIQ
ncbi:MAG TPA: hypothetical protein ENN72_01320 [Firmicutes bacterium]|jgi:hypothetical protein|nr:hypothetical protein [Bacillota bacterium]